MGENLNWQSEISHVANKVSKSTEIIRKSGFYLSTKTVRTLYFSLIYRSILFLTATLCGPLLTELTLFVLRFYRN